VKKINLVKQAYQNKKKKSSDERFLLTAHSRIPLEITCNVRMAGSTHQIMEFVLGRCQKNGKCFERQRQIAAHCGRSIRTVNRALAFLKRKRLITMLDQPYGFGNIIMPTARLQWKKAENTENMESYAKTGYRATPNLAYLRTESRNDKYNNNRNGIHDGEFASIKDVINAPKTASGNADVGYQRIHYSKEDYEFTQRKLSRQLIRGSYPVSSGVVL